MKKIMIIGSAGAGKSTLARKISDITGVKVFHLDRFLGKPGWISISREELKKDIGNIMKLESWIIDGNYSSTIEMRLEEADTVIFLDFPVWVCLWGAVKRRIVYANKSRPDITVGCDEKLDWEFIKWILTFPLKRRGNIHKALEDHSDGKHIYIFKSRKEANKFIEKIGKSYNAAFKS